MVSRYTWGKSFTQFTSLSTDFTNIIVLPWKHFCFLFQSLQAMNSLRPFGFDPTEPFLKWKLHLLFHSIILVFSNSPFSPCVRWIPPWSWLPNELDLNMVVIFKIGFKAILLADLHIPTISIFVTLAGGWQDLTHNIIYFRGKWVIEKDGRTISI